MARKPWEHVTWILLEILKSPSLSISRERVMEGLALSRAQFYKVIKQLTEGTDDTPPLLEEVKNGETSIFKFKNNIWSDMAGASLEAKFYFECYKHLGTLLDSEYNQASYELDDPTVTPGMVKKLSKKFFYLSKTQAYPYSKEQKTFLDKIVRALLNENEIFLYYPKHDIEKAKVARRVKPLSLCQHRDDLYLLGLEGEDKTYNEKNIRTYKINRIEKLVESRETFKYPSTWNPSERYRETSGLIIGEKKKAVVQIYHPFSLILQEKNIMNAKALTSGEENPIVYEFTYTDPNEFLGQMAVYAECVEILEPESLREQFQNKLESGIKKNIKKIA